MFVQGARSCLIKTFDTIANVMRGYEMNMPDAASNCLRFAFHDAGTYRKDTGKGG